jgi:Rap1a immunity proteins
LKITLLLFVILIAMSTKAQNSSNVTGVKLLEQCQAGAKMENDPAHHSDQLVSYNVGYCDGILWGVWNTLEDDGIIKSPANATRHQVNLIVIKYLQDHPELLNEDEVRLIRKALINVWGKP